MLRRRDLHCIQRNWTAELFRERGDLSIANYARYDEPEEVEVRGHVESKTMHRDPLAEADSNRAELATEHPHSPKAFDAFCMNSELDGCANHRLFEIGDVAPDVAT